MPFGRDILAVKLAIAIAIHSATKLIVTERRRLCPGPKGPRTAPERQFLFAC